MPPGVFGRVDNLYRKHIAQEKYLSIANRFFRVMNVTISLSVMHALFGGVTKTACGDFLYFPAMVCTLVFARKGCLRILSDVASFFLFLKWEITPACPHQKHDHVFLNKNQILVQIIFTISVVYCNACDKIGD